MSWIFESAIADLSWRNCTSRTKKPGIDSLRFIVKLDGCRKLLVYDFARKFFDLVTPFRSGPLQKKRCETPRRSFCQQLYGVPIGSDAHLELPSESGIHAVRIFFAPT